MIPILLLDCSPELEAKLRTQGYDVESGNIGFQTGVRQLPSQVYEKTVLIYNPTSLAKKDGTTLEKNEIFDATPQFGLQHLERAIEDGTTCLIFVNPLPGTEQTQNAAYSWIPYMPATLPTHDKLIGSDSFEYYPYYKWKCLAPIVNTHDVHIPVLRKLVPPKPAPYENDVLPLMTNGQRDVIAVLILRGRGCLIVLPKFKSNDEVIEAFLDRVLPEMYSLKARVALVDQYQSPNEAAAADELKNLQLERKYIESQLAATRSEFATASREKSARINSDPTARQVLAYHDMALKQEPAALFYLYKILEVIENRYGGEANAIKLLGCHTEWKHIKRSANESYGDMRHAPKPADVIKKWTREDIKNCFADTEKIVLSYFDVLFAQVNAPET